MIMRNVAFICALTAGACGGADTRPPEAPAASTSSASGDSTMTSVSTTTPTGANAPNSARRPATTASSNEGTSGRVDSSGRSTTLAAGTNPNANVTAPSAVPTVANNPGDADQTKNADNTKINERDRQGALTPMDQGNSSSETNITATIRKALMGDKTLSFTAKNVKVITIGNKVTLRGPVKSDQEKASVEALAKQTPGVSEVDNQLEVKK
jgi:hyperosmotically inducible periplasmic protein